MDIISWYRSLILRIDVGILLPPFPITLTFKDQVEKLLGQGTFGKVVQARDRKRGGSLVAIKIIRAVHKYREASKIELRVLSTLKANDGENRNRCIHLRDCFDYRGHICIVMDLLGQSVFDFLKSNSFVPFPNSQIQSFARQLFTSVACKSHSSLNFTYILTTYQSCMI
jgi:dual-specificity kinase